VSSENTAHAKVVSFVGDDKRVADIGCGPGNIARLLQERGCSVVGVDANAEALFAAKPFCERTVAADLDRDSLADVLQGERFDVIVFADVLEHLRNPGRTLLQSKTLLRPGGYVVASIPNVAHGSVRLSLLLGTFEYQPLGILDETHVRWFTRSTVLRLFKECGFAIEALDRTALPVFSDSSLTPNVLEADFPAGLASAVELADEGETLQFVVKARPAGADEALVTNSDGKDEGLIRALRGSMTSVDPAALRESEQRRRYMRDLEERYARLEESYRILEDRFTRNVDDLRAHIRGMETSAFWRLRTAVNKLLRRSP
jgi:2-polyprenyl-3-methyl-5-hydroxy-6-metoxy-1,4-benzoquinol methylase